MFNANSIFIIHELITQDFPTAHGADIEKIEQLYNDCFSLFLKTKDKSVYDFAACICYKIVQDKPFNSQNKKVAIRCAISILYDEEIELVPDYVELISILQEVEARIISLQKLKIYLKNNSKKLKN